jgi:hypothetical protein
LKAGESKNIEINVKARDLAYYNDKTGKWTVDTDNYVINVCSSSRAIRSTNNIKIVQ